MKISSLEIYGLYHQGHKKLVPPKYY